MSPDPEGLRMSAPRLVPNWRRFPRLAANRTATTGIVALALVAGALSQA